MLDDRVILVLDIHLMAHLAVCRCSQQPMYDVEHLVIIGIQTLVDVEGLLAVSFKVRLVEDAQHFLQSVVDLTVKTGNLDDDAVVGQAVDEWMGQALGYEIVIVVVGMTTYIKHRFLDVADLMAQQVNGYHRNGIALFALRQDVLRVGVVHAQILAETERLGLEPCLLQLDEYQMLASVRLTNGGPEIYSEYGQAFAGGVCIFVATHFHIDDLLFQQCRQQCLCNALVLHEVLEHDVVYGICYNHSSLFM